MIVSSDTLKATYVNEVLLKDAMRDPLRAVPASTDGAASYWAPLCGFTHDLVIGNLIFTRRRRRDNKWLV